MTIDKLLKTFAYDDGCDEGCFYKTLTTFGQCKAKCKQNSERALSETERTVILYSMIYVERKDLHPDVREHLWLRASGSA